ncbi:MAG TPA: SprB repeat-containing protein, partial [Chitinophagales bacterium]|nr:SprB repeat-containing protein [Chitinophagales bacterium]
WAETFHTYTPPGKLGGPSLGPISVSASGSMVVFGGPNDRAGMGATWAYHYAGGQWTVMGNKLVGDGDVGAAGQGASITITADGRKIISAGAGDNGSSGALWSFIKNGNTWVQSGEKQTGSPDHPGARLGAHGVGISADGKTTVANAYDAWVWYPTAVGLWVFKDSADQLRQDGNRLWADSGVSYYQSSGGCAISDDGLTIAAGNIDDSLDKGGVKVFVRNGNAWVQQGGVLRGSIGEHNGRSLSLSANGNILAMGSFYDTAAFIFRRTGGLWQEEKIITGSSWKFNDRIATSVSDDGNTVAVGCYKDSGDYGVVLIYQYDGNAWNMQGKLRGSGAEGKPGLGFSVSLSGDGNTLVAGGVYDGLNSVNGTGAHGAVWVFKRSGNNWNQYGTKLIPNDTVGAAFVGSAVAITPNSYTIAVGGSGDNGAGANWVFEFAGIRVIKDTIVNATCDNNADGSIIIHAINGVAPYSYHWSASGAANSDTLKNVLPGFYYVTVTDAAGDSSTQSFQVGASGGFTIASTYKAQCGILSTGQIILTATNGTAPYQYNWNTNPAGTDSIASNLVAGTYLYTVTDATGCQITGNSTIPYTAFWTSAYATRANCAANNGSAIINAQGGTSPYTYIWNTTPPQTTANASGLAGGLYQFTVTELTGCQTTGQVQVDSICKSVIEGTVYLDANGNCIRDNNEVAYAGWGVLAQSQSGNAYATSNSLGYYHMEVTGNATYDIKTFSGNSSCFNFNNCDSSHTVQLNNAGDTAGYNIGITWVGSYDLDATLSSGIARPGVDLTYTIYVSNIAPVALSGNATITFVYDADLIY